MGVVTRSRKLCDDRRHHETDRPADRKADEQFVKRDQKMRPEEGPLRIQCEEDLARLRHDVLRHIQDAQQHLGAADDHHGDQRDNGRL